MLEFLEKGKNRDGTSDFVLAGFPTPKPVTRSERVVPATQESEEVPLLTKVPRWPRAPLVRWWLGGAYRDRQSDSGQYAATKDAVSGIAESLLELADEDTFAEGHSRSPKTLDSV